MSYSKILDNFYLGNRYSSGIIKTLDLIISVGCNTKNKTVENIKISLRDNITSNITPHIDYICDTINTYLSNNKKILIHCKAGINRSTAFVVAYLIKYNNMNLEEAKSHILDVRKVKFKKNFIEQIIKHFNSEDSEDSEDLEDI